MIRLALTAAATLGLLACAQQTPLSRTGYRVPLEGNPYAPEARRCARTCMRWQPPADPHPDMMGHHHLIGEPDPFACIEKCPGTRVIAGGCLPVDRPPAAICIEKIAPGTKQPGHPATAGDVISEIISALLFPFVVITRN